MKNRFFFDKRYQYAKIRLDKKYKIPQDLCIVDYKNKILAISPSTANWIVLESYEQLSILRCLKNGDSIDDLLKKPKFNQSDVQYVVTQIEARLLCSKVVHGTTEDGTSLHLYLTNKCNMACPHCYMFSGKANDNELSTDEVLSLIKNYKQIGNGQRITLSGGEPTIHINFDLIVKTAKLLGLEVKILTNGVLMTRERIAKIAPYVDSVQISIDGFSEESNSTIRGIGNFNKALDSIDAFVFQGIETSVAITPSYKLLQRNLNDYIEFAEKLLTKYEGKPFQIKFSEGLSFGRDINPSNTINDNYASLVNKIQHALYGDQYELMTFVNNMSNNVIMDNCMFGIFSIASNGNVYLCPEIGNLLPIANIRTSSFEDICSMSYSAEQATLVSKLQPCKDCELCYICGGGCRTKEFPTLVKRTSFKDIDYDKIPPRECNTTIKEHFYDLMIESNEYLFTSELK